MPITPAEADRERSRADFETKLRAGVTGPYLRTQAAADYIGSTKSSLEKMRFEGVGPVYYKNGRICIYATADLDAYVLAQRRTHTRDAAPAPAAA